MKKAITILFVVTLLFTSCNNSGSSRSDSSNRQKSAEELKMELKQQEQSSATYYLSASGTYKKSFWGNKFIINCTITNKATVASYKDVVIRVTYYSKTKTELGNNDNTVYEIIPPNSTKTIELKVGNYKDVNSIGISVISAIPVE